MKAPPAPSSFGTVASTMRRSRNCRMVSCETLNVLPPRVIERSDMMRVLLVGDEGSAGAVVFRNSGVHNAQIPQLPDGELRDVECFAAESDREVRHDACPFSG